MNTKIKTLVLSCFLFLMTGNAFSQEMKPGIFSIDSILEYKVINPEMCKAIDTIIFYTKDCFNFSVLNNPYYINIHITDTSRFWVTSMPYSCTNIRRWHLRTVEKGICYYKGDTVLVSSIAPSYINCFFESTDRKSNLYYYNSENILDHVSRANDGAEIIFDYNDNKLFINEEDISPCGNSLHFFYIVQPEDTWIDIAKKCGCSVEDLTDGFADSEKPIQGYLIVVEYRFENGKLVNSVRIQ